jgi:8-oxo-dGTP diphosphatase
MTQDYVPPRAVVAADVVCVLNQPDLTSVLLIERANDPFKGEYAIPGGIVEETEDVIDGAIRELLEETNISASEADLTLLGIYGKPGRDPRGRTITVAYYFMTSDSSLFSNVKAQDDAKSFKFFDIFNLPDLAFDHNKIISDLIKRLNL